ncbi:MAG: hypothetical protein Q9227_000083 [Pyrenula ochraceoflavens]
MGDWDFYCALCASSFDGNETVDESIRNAFDALQEKLSEEDMNSFLEDLFPESVRKWHSILHALSYNPESPNVRKVYISGAGESASYGTIDVKRGHDESAPGSAQNPDEDLDLQAYPLPEAASDMAIPMHAECLFQVLPKAIGYMSTNSNTQWRSWTIDQVDNSVLWESFQPTLNDYQSHTGLDHFERNEAKGEQYWSVTESDVCSVANPTIIPSLHQFLDNLPTLNSSPIQKSPDSRGTNSHNGSQQHDTFAKMSSDLFLYLSDFMLMKDLCSLRTASRYAASVPLSSAYWKRRVTKDMPWVWEISVKTDSAEDSVDWKFVYQRLYSDSYRPPRLDRPSGTPGLWNRRRIWKTCEELAKMYIPRMNEKKRLDRSDDQDEELVKATYSTHVPVVAWKVHRSATSVQIPLISSWNQPSEDKKLVFHWNKDGLLFGLQLIDEIKVPGSVLYTVGSVSQDHHSSIPLKSSNWIESLELWMTTVDLRKMGRKGDTNDKTGIVCAKATFRQGQTLLVSKPESCFSERISKRIFYPRRGSTIVGIQAAIEDIEEGIVTRFGLMEAVPGSVSPPSDTQVPIREKVSWLNEIPDPLFEAQEYKLGYWSPGASQDLIPREALIFGATPADRTHVTGLSIDSSLRRIEVHYDNAPSHAIGIARDELINYMDVTRQPRTKHFPIDGPNGEYVIGIQLQVNHLPFELRVMTNYRRQAFWGQYWVNRNGDGADHPAYSACYDKAVGGLYASFGYASGKELQLSSISTLLVPDSPNTQTSSSTPPSPPPPPPLVTVADMPSDSHGQFWEPSAPPAGWTEHGPVYGSDKACGTVTWMDLTRAIARIDAAHYGQTNTKMKENTEGLRPFERWQRVRERPFVDYLKGLRIVYADADSDREVRTIAGPPADEPEPLEALAGNHASYEGASLVDGWLSSRWEVNGGKGGKVKRVRVWSDGYESPEDVQSWQKRGSSFGMRFEVEGCGWGPEFGDTFGEPLKEFVVGEHGVEGEGELVGLKIIVGAGGSGEQSTASDVVNCVGAQALVRGGTGPAQLK